MQGNITASNQIFGTRDGMFLTACYQHEESCRDCDFYGIVIDGQNNNNTFTNWYGGGPTAGSRRIDGAWKSDATCAPQGTNHGAC
jgi:hypothetical protein